MAAARRLIALLAIAAGVTAAGWYFFHFRNLPKPLEAQFPVGLESELILRFDETTLPDRSTRVLFNVDPRGKPHLLVGRNIIAVKFSDESDAKLIPLPGKESISDFAWMHDGSLLLTEGHRLVLLTGDGLESVQSLPQAGMRIAPASSDGCYLFGGSTSEQKRNLYLYRQKGDLLHLLESEAPIAAVAGNGEFTFVAINNAIYLLAPGNPLELILQTQDPVTALAIGPESSLFYATSAGVGFCGGTGNGHLFVLGQGAEIQVREDLLYLFFPNVGIMKCSPANLFLHGSDTNQAPKAG
jgi:hypothetical protein